MHTLYLPIGYLAEGIVLKSYQIVGLNWLWACHQQGVNGVLADEMGEIGEMGEVVELGEMDESVSE